MATAAVLDADAQYRRGQAYVAMAAIVWSTAGVLQRGLTASTATQVAGRAAFAAIALLACLAVMERGGLLRSARAAGGAGIAFAFAIAGASACFIAALNHTSVAHVLFIQAIAPVLAAIMARVVLGEAVSGRTTAAMAVALGGVGLMVGGPGEGDLAGDVLALGMAFCFAVAIVVSRHRRDVSMAPATFLSQIILLAAFLPFAHPAQALDDDLLALALLGAGQIGLGLLLLTVGARLIPAAQVALISLLEVVLGPIWVWFAYGEVPATATLIGGAVVVGAVVLQVSDRTGREASAEDAVLPR
jgi:drug/metabolite transporter (DMT)-like permease